MSLAPSVLQCRHSSPQKRRRVTRFGALKIAEQGHSRQDQASSFRHCYALKSVLGCFSPTFPVTWLSSFALSTSLSPLAFMWLSKQSCGAVLLHFTRLSSPWKAEREKNLMVFALFSGLRGLAWLVGTACGTTLASSTIPLSPMDLSFLVVL